MTQLILIVDNKQQILLIVESRKNKIKLNNNSNSCSRSSFNMWNYMIYLWKDCLMII